MEEVKVGDTIVYKLRASDLPIVPNQLWHGLVIQINRNRSDGVSSYFVKSVELPDTEGETVYPFQVVSVEPAQADRS